VRRRASDEEVAPRLELFGFTDIYCLVSILIVPQTEGLPIITKLGLSVNNTQGYGNIEYA